MVPQAAVVENRRAKLLEAEQVKGPPSVQIEDANVLRARPAKSSGLISTCNPVHLDPAPSGLHESEECAHQRPSKAALVAKSQAILQAQLFTDRLLAQEVLTLSMSALALRTESAITWAKGS